VAGLGVRLDSGGGVAGVACEAPAVAAAGGVLVVEDDLYAELGGVADQEVERVLALVEDAVETDVDGAAVAVQ